MSRFYLDSSMALHAMLPGGDARAPAWLDSALEAGDELHSSTLLELELVRVLRRERLDVELARLVLDRVELTSIDDNLLRSAAAIEPHVKSLDAIHLATSLLLGPGVTMVTHDSGLSLIAASMGRAVIDPLSTMSG